MNCFGDGDGGIPRGGFPILFWNGFTRFSHGRIEIGSDGEMSALFMPEVEDIGAEPGAVESKPEVESLGERLPEGMAKTERVGLRSGVAFAKDGEGDGVVEFGDGSKERIISANLFDIRPAGVFFVRRKDAAVRVNGETRKTLFGYEPPHECGVEVAEPKDGEFCKFSEECAQRGIVRKLFDAEEFGQRGIRIERVDIIEACAAGEKHVGDTHDHFAWTKPSVAFFEGQSLVDAMQQFQLLGQSTDECQSREGCNGLIRFFDLKFDQVWKYHLNHLVFLFHPLGEISGFFGNLSLSGFPERKTRFSFS